MARYKSRRQRVWRLGRGHVGGVDADLADSTAPGLFGAEPDVMVVGVVLGAKIYGAEVVF